MFKESKINIELKSFGFNVSSDINLFDLKMMISMNIPYIVGGFDNAWNYIIKKYELGNNKVYSGSYLYIIDYMMKFSYKNYRGFSINYNRINKDTYCISYAYVV